MYKGKPQKYILYFLGGLNKKSQDPTSQPKNVCSIFKVFNIFPNIFKYVQTLALKSNTISV
jgi:hypothetical protein